MKKLIYLTLVLVASVLAACAKSSKNKNQVVQTCGVNGYYGAGCVTPTTLLPSNTGPVGFLDQSLQRGGNFSSFLKEFGMVCDIAGNTGGWTDCSTWDRAALKLQASPNKNTVTVTFGAYSSAHYGYSLPGSWSEFFFGGMSNMQPQTNQMLKTVEFYIGNWNNSQGFKIYGRGQSGTLAWNKDVEIRVANGKIEDSLLVYELYYGGSLAGSGTLYKCANSSCY